MAEHMRGIRRYPPSGEQMGIESRAAQRAAWGSFGRLRIVSLGERARRALERSGGLAHPLQSFAESPWYQAGRDIVWVGSKLPAMHPRAVMTASPPVRGSVLHFESVPRTSWRPHSQKLDRGQIKTLVSAARKLRREARSLGTASGFGALLVGETPLFPLDRAVPLVDALSRAFDKDDPDAVVVIALPLLGLGAGLTPSGDDLVGGAIFGRRIASGADPRWVRAGKTLSREIPNRSHAVSAALFSDLAAGRSFAPLHEIVQALVAKNQDGALRAARTLVAIGHSSGWDMLSGFLMGVARTRVSPRIE